MAKPRFSHPTGRNPDTAEVNKEEPSDPTSGDSSPSGWTRLQVDAQWTASDEHRAMVRRHYVIGIPSAILTLASLVGVLYFGSSISRPESAPDTLALFLAMVSGIVFIAGYALIAYVFIDRTRQRRLFITKLEMGQADVLQERERNIAESGEPLSLPVLWSVTQERIDYYHRIATSQAEVSFRNGAITSYVGFSLLIAFAVLGALTAGNLYTSITLGVLGAVGAALTGYLGATFMKLQSEASSQLRQFFTQPVDSLRLLGAERLIETLPESERAASVQLVIAAIMKDGRSDSRSG